MNTIIEKIRAEVERRKNNAETLRERNICIDILYFLSDLEKSENPINPVLQDFPTTEKEMQDFLATHERIPVPERLNSLERILQEQPVCEDLKKRASEIYPNKEGDLCYLHSTLQRGGYIRGYQDCKEQMMKEAICYVAQPDTPIGNVLVPFIRIGETALSRYGIKVGDKVKLIIVKED